MLSLMRITMGESFMPDKSFAFDELSAPKGSVFTGYTVQSVKGTHFVLVEDEETC